MGGQSPFSHLICKAIILEKQRMENDLHIIRRTIDGDQQAFAELVDGYKNYVFSICLRVLKKREEAEEAAQDTFMKVYGTLGSFEGKSKFSTWLYTVAYRTALDKVRTRKPYTQPVEDTDGDSPPLQIAEEEAARPDRRLDARDLKDHLEKAIQLLPPLDASVMTLFYLHERSVREIAEITDLTETNVKTKLHRLRERLKTKLNHYLEAEIKDLL